MYLHSRTVSSEIFYINSDSKKVRRTWFYKTSLKSVILFLFRYRIPEFLNSFIRSKRVLCFCKSCFNFFNLTFLNLSLEIQEEPSAALKYKWIRETTTLQTKCEMHCKFLNTHTSDFRKFNANKYLIEFG